MPRHDPCSVCHKRVALKRETSLKCSKCNVYIHKKCTGLSVQDFAAISSRKGRIRFPSKEWLCLSCSNGGLSEILEYQMDFSSQDERKACMNFMRQEDIIPINTRCDHYEMERIDAETVIFSLYDGMNINVCGKDAIYFVQYKNGGQSVISMDRVEFSTLILLIMTNYQSTKKIKGLTMSKVVGVEHIIITRDLSDGKMAVLQLKRYHALNIIHAFSNGYFDHFLGLAKK